MEGRARVNVKVEPRSTQTLNARNRPYIVSILFTRVKCTRVRKFRDSENPP